MKGRDVILMKTLLVTTSWGEGENAGRKIAHTAWEKCWPKSCKISILGDEVDIVEEKQLDAMAKHSSSN